VVAGVGRWAATFRVVCGRSADALGRGLGLAAARSWSAR